MKKFCKAVALLLSAAMVSALAPAGAAFAADDKLLAFPGAEGGGKYAKGARASENPVVYHVTNLNDSGEGSFRDAVSQPGRYVVFDIDGAVKLTSGTVSVAGNTTILGQTAPGEGITITGNDVQTKNGAEDIIIRYLKVRPTDANGVEPDGLGGRFNTNVIFDHCSLSWSVDELITLYAGSYESTSDSNPHGNHLTVQNTLAAESLRMSSHFKGAHGYGGIMGADYSSYHHNLLAHHDSRSPRLDREMDGTEVINNVIYDWGQTNSAYGGEPGSMHYKTFNPTRVNYTDNYYQYGPSTRSSLRTRIFDVTNDTSKSDGHKSDFYFNGNYVGGSTSVTANNKSGINNSANANLLDEPVSMVDDTGEDFALTPQTYSEAYDSVLANVGATLPKRDAIDARIIDDVKHQTGRVINNATEVGGLIDFASGTTVTRVFAVPDEWKTANGVSELGETDIITSGEFAGYSVIEAYVNDWTAKQSEPTNPSITVSSPTVASNSKTTLWTVINVNETVNYAATATDMGSPVTKMELYDGNDLIKAYEGAASINDNISLEEGTHFLTCRAYNEKGEKTQSTEAIVYVKGTEPTEEQANGFTFTEIGSGKYAGKGGIAANADGTMTLYGSGTSGNAGSSSYGTASTTTDSVSYYYKKLSGNFDVSIKVGAIERFENQALNGLMLRETLDAGSRMVMAADSILKYGENDRLLYRTTANTKATVEYFKTADNVTVENSSSGDNYDVAPYMRIVRYGDDVYTYLSQSGTDWTDDVRQVSKVTLEGLADEVYIGYATDSADTISVIPYFACSDFEINYVKTGDEVTDPGADDTFYVPVYEDHTTENGFAYSESFLMENKDATSGLSVGNWVTSSDGTLATTATEVKMAVEGNDTPKLSLNDKAVQIEVPEEYQTGKYTVDYDFLTTDTSSRSFRVYLDNAVHPYNSETGQATEMGVDGSFVHILDINGKVYATTDVASLSTKTATADAAELFAIDANKWYHVTISGTNGADDLTITVSQHGTDGQYNPDSLTQVYTGSLPVTVGRDTTFKQLKFMKTAAGKQYYDNIIFAGEKGDDPEPIIAGSGDVDGNGIVTANDPAIVLSYANNKELTIKDGWNISEGDINGDGSINADDAAKILLKVLNYTK